MRRRNRTDRPDDEREIKKRRFFIKKNGRVRFDWLRRFHYWWLGGRSITRSIFRITAAWQGILLIGGLLVAFYLMAAFYTQSGEFIIRVDHAGEKKLVISDTEDFSEELITLNGTAIDDANNISIFDIDPEVTEIDGDHNGQDYVAYTFYVKNIGHDPITYTYNLSIQRATKDVDHAVWVLLYHNGQQQIFAKENASGEPETQSGRYEYPFMEDAKMPEQYSYDEQSGVYTLTTEPFASSRIVELAERPRLQAGEVDKFTVVIWLEGEDPECVNDILGGTIEMMMKLRY